MMVSRESISVENSRLKVRGGGGRGGRGGGREGGEGLEMRGVGSLGSPSLSGSECKGTGSRK